jgi:hypothetical protein
VGAYQLNQNLTITITLDNGQLMAKATNQPKVPVFAENTDFFFKGGRCSARV